LAADIRHVVCGRSAGLQDSNCYREARFRVLAETAAGERSRIVLLTDRCHEAPEIAIDVPTDIFPMFCLVAPGSTLRIDRAIVNCLFSSVHENTLFWIYETGHPIWAMLKREMRERGIQFRPNRPNS
jgi:hypothetical protein